MQPNIAQVVENNIYSRWAGAVASGLLYILIHFALIFFDDKNSLILWQILVYATCFSHQLNPNVFHIRANINNNNPDYVVRFETVIWTS